MPPSCWCVPGNSDDPWQRLRARSGQSLRWAFGVLERASQPQRSVSAFELRIGGQLSADAVRSCDSTQRPHQYHAKSRVVRSLPRWCLRERPRLPAVPWYPCCFYPHVLSLPFCAAGRFSSVAGAAACELCAAGRFSGGGLAACALCVRGRSSSAGASVCTQCTNATFAPVEGSRSCTPCPSGRNWVLTCSLEC